MHDRDINVAKNINCETCCDSDRFLGYADTKEEAWELLNNDCDIDGRGGWNMQYIEEFLRNNFVEE